MIERHGINSAYRLPTRDVLTVYINKSLRTDRACNISAAKTVHGGMMAHTPRSYFPLACPPHDNPPSSWHVSRRAEYTRVRVLSLRNARYVSRRWR